MPCSTEFDAASEQVDYICSLTRVMPSTKLKVENVPKTKTRIFLRERWRL